MKPVKPSNPGLKPGSDESFLKVSGSRAFLERNEGVALSVLSPCLNPPVTFLVP